MIKQLLNLDRRIIYLALLGAVIIPYLFPFKLPMQVSAPVKNLYDYVESLPEGSLVLLSFDYGPSTKIECDPMARSLLRHMFKKHLKVVALAMWPEGAVLAQNAMQQMGDAYARKYGEDYLNLGYKTGGSVLLKSLGNDFGENFPKDMAGTKTGDLPLSAGIKNIRDFKLAVSLSGGRPGLTDYVTIFSCDYKEVPVAGGTTAVSVPECYPYLDSKQLIGLLGGLKGAAEYEELIDYAGEASQGMAAQSIAHFFLAFLIILANVAWFLSRGKKEAQ